MNNDTSSIVVVILTYNQLDKTVRCLSSFRSVTSPPFRIVLWDNGSQDGTTDWVKEEFPEVFVHYHPDNLGVASGRNAAAELAMSKFNPSYLFFIDNDTVVTPGFLQTLLHPFDENKRVALTTPKIRNLKDRHLLDVAGGVTINFWLGSQTVIGFKENDVGQYDVQKKCIAVGIVLVRTDVFRELGGYDPVYDPYGYEDVDFSLRVNRSGYDSLYVPESLIFHEASRTFVGDDYDEQYARLKAKNWLVFLNRHATHAEKLGFFCIGGPIMFFRAAIREARVGNFGAIRGLISGVFDYRKPSRPLRRS